MARAVHGGEGVDPLSGCAASPQGDATGGLAKPVPRWHWPWAATVSADICCKAGCQMLKI
ncbi:MAG TPA: hypothetical protein DEV74_06190 [Acidovorax sp.]|nr:hypothetical protein [Acidovorax sp.]